MKTDLDTLAASFVPAINQIRFSRKPTEILSLPVPSKNAIKLRLVQLILLSQLLTVYEILNLRHSLNSSAEIANIIKHMEKLENSFTESF